MPDDIEEFLRRAAQRRQAKAGKPAQQPGEQRRPAQQQPVQQRPVPQQPVPQRPLAQEPTREFPSAPERSSTTVQGTKLASRPEYSIRTDERRSSIPTAEPVIEEAEIVQLSIVEHVQQTFGHEVGTLPHQEIKPVEKVTPLSALTKVLGTRDGMRTAILVREILERPQHRWE